MSLLQISEPNQSKQPHKHTYALGIDLGTTHSLVGVVRSGRSDVLSFGDTPLLPSVVYYGAKTDAPVVGKKALMYNDPANTIISAKRFMGRSRKDIKFSHPYTLTGADDTMPAFVTAQGEKSPVETSAHILARLKSHAEAALPKDSIVGAVITVPAYFDDAQRAATKDAAHAAGLQVLRLLNEPTAAAIAYGLDKPTQDARTYLIYDLGGGTFDVSILRLKDGVFEVLATAGNSALGGDDMDRLIAHWLIKSAQLDPASISNDTKSELATLAKSYKQTLSHDAMVVVDIDIDGTPLNTLLDRDTLAKICEPVIRRSLQSCQQALNDAKLSKDMLDDVVLVGGSTRMPIVQDAVQTFFDKPALCSINPDEVVALGAARAAHQLINQSDDNLLLLDVTPLSLGLETMGGLTEVIIPRNTPIPVTRRQTFTTYADGQTGMVIHVVQGERDTVADCRSLARFTLSGIPPMKAGHARIDVDFRIDANGQLTVSAMEASSKVASHVNVSPSYGLSEAQQEALLKAGFEHAQADKLARRLIEAKVENEREFLALDAALVEFAHLLSSDEVHALATQLAQSRLAQDSDDIQAVLAARSALKPLSDAFAARIMDSSIQARLSGTNMNDW